MKTYAELFKLYSKKIKKNKLELSDLKFLFKETLLDFGIDYFVYQNKAFDIKIKEIIDSRFKKLLSGKPIQYILGYSYFYGYKIPVNKHVLIPRFDTEILVENVLKETKGKRMTVADIGTGSGCIALALKSKQSNLNLIATDISVEALKVAKQNFKNYKLNIKTFVGDLLEPLIKNNITLNILVSNPPYISKRDKEISPSVKKYEPKLALFSSKNGLSHIEQILRSANQVVKPGGLIFLEIGHLQRKDVELLVAKHIRNLEFLGCIKDYSNKDRIIKLKLKNQWFIHFNSSFIMVKYLKILNEIIK